MARKPKSKSGSGKWTDGLDPKKVDEALEDATVDAHDEDERHAGLLDAVQDELGLTRWPVPIRNRKTTQTNSWTQGDAAHDPATRRFTTGLLHARSCTA